MPVAVEGRAAAQLSEEAREQMRAARRVVEKVAHGTHEHTYGVNTGFGRFVSKVIPEELTEELQLRLLEMGLTPGTHLKVIRAAAFGGPLDILVRGYQLSLRRDEAASVWLDDEDDEK